MMRSMYSGVSGLKNHQTRMDVIGNNIANVNTTGYKKSRTVFKDMLYQSVRGASAPTAERGGLNPSGVGLGVALASIDQIHTPAPASSTGKMTDLAIDGGGYFVVNNGNARYYTRAGSFDFDEQGNFYNTANGYRVQGWMATLQDLKDDKKVNTDSDPTNISIKDFKEIDAQETTSMEFTGNLDSSLPYAPGRNEVQVLKFDIINNGGAEGRFFTLELDGNITDYIKTGANSETTAQNIQAALAALPNIGAGNVEVKWDPARGQYDITFTGILENTEMSLLSFAEPPSAVEETKGILNTTAEEQRLSMGGVKNENDTFALVYGEDITAPITVGADSTATATNIQTALVNIGLVGVTVAADGADFIVTFPATMGDVTTPLRFAPPTGVPAAVSATVKGTQPLAELPINEVKTLDLSAFATGTFTLTYDGVTTDPAIDFNAGAAAIKSALEKIPALNENINITEVTAPVAAAAGPPPVTAKGGVYNIEFINGLGAGSGKAVEDLGIKNPDGTTGMVDTTTKGREAGYPDEMISGSREVYTSLGEPKTLHYRFFRYEIDPGSVVGEALDKEPITRWACDISLDPLFEEQEGYDASSDFRAMDLADPSNVTGNGEKVFRIYNIEFDMNGNIKKDDDKASFEYYVSLRKPDPNDPNPTAPDNITCTIDLTGLCQRDGSSTAWISRQDGYAKGSLTSYTIGADGGITGVFDNGQMRELGKVALASFENPAGLQQIGGTMFIVSTNSGAPHINAPGSGELGSIIPSSLEMSNVDLSEEFTDMIITQRGFQANSRIITTSDEMLQELVNLKR